MGAKLGMEAKLYFGAALIGPWTELKNVKDVTLNLETGEADVTTRGNAGWRATIGTLKDGSIEFEMVWDTEDAGFEAIKDAFFGNTPIAIAAMDGAIETPGSEGLQGLFSVTNFTRNEPLEEVLAVQVTLKPTYSATPPQWVVVAAP